MYWSRIVLAVAFVACGEGALLRGHAVSLEAEASGDLAALISEAESEDRNFLFAQIDQTESDLVQLQRLLNATVKATEAKKAPEAKKQEAPAAKKEAVTAVAKKEDKEEDPAKVMASLGMPAMPSLSSVKGMKGAAALAPMLAMLKGLYQDSKDRISQQNVREEKSKKWFAEKEADHKAKLDAIEGRFKNHTLSEEFRTNETRDENRYFNYWERVRQRQHRQFHTNLKIQHAMMMKTKKMVDMYEKALSTKPADQEKAKKELGAMTGMPEIVFLQNVQKTVGSFVQESLDEVRKEREELQQWHSDGLEY